MKKMLVALSLLIFLSSCAPAVIEPTSVAPPTAPTDDPFAPHIVKTLYPTDDLIVAEIDLSGEVADYYSVDATGEEDSAYGIQNALDAVSDMGGGTVYLPSGRYLITETVRVPAYCTLQGDWQDPDDGTAYGTVIIADPYEIEDNLFEISGSAGVNGLTVYYPRQDLKDPVPYGFTFYTNGIGAASMLASVTRCTVINGYRGIGACVKEANAHEQFSIERVKGTFLCAAAELYNQSDVGTWKSVTVSPKYWAECPWLNDGEAIAAYTETHTTGMILGDLEWTEFTDIHITDCQTGIRVVKGKRIAFAGSFCDTVVEDTGIALDVEVLDDRWGMTIVNSFLEGNDYAVRNRSDGVVKMSNTGMNGRVAGDIRDEGLNDAAQLHPDYAFSHPKPEPNLYLFDGDKFGQTDVSVELQALLDRAGATGGLVYLPAGYYLLDGPIKVPKGVELRGACASPNRETGSVSGGTVLLSTYGDDAGNTAADTALITLCEEAGVAGLRVFYPENGPADDEIVTGYAIRGEGRGVYCVNCAIAGAAFGIDFSLCDGHYIKKLSALCYYNTLKVGGNGGVVEGCLHNGTVLVRCSILTRSYADESYYEKSEQFMQLFDHITRPLCSFLIVGEGNSERIFNCFAYGVSDFLVNDGGTDTFAVNIGADNLGNALVVSRDGSATVLGALRWNGQSVEWNYGDLRIYTRLTIGDKDESPFICK